MNRRSTHPILTLGLLGLLSASPALAQQSECDTDADCDASFVCEVTGGGTCAQPACEPGGECPAPACESFEYRQCVPGPCESDADCGDNQVCVTEVYTIGGDSCPPGPDCVPSAPVEQVYSECRNRWEAPCELAADCGPGFTCEEAESCWCNGGMGVACVDGQPCPEPDPVEPECGCDPTGEFYCVLTVVECADSTACGDGMICGDNPDRAVCQSAGGGFEGAPADPSEDPCGGGNEPTKICMPEGYYGGGDFGRGGVGIAESQNAATGGDGAATDDSASSPMGEGGNAKVCSVRAVGAGSQGNPLWLLAAAAWLIRRRRAQG